MKKDPLMSIIMAVRSEKRNILPAVQGICNIDGNFELIFVEGHSEDGTLSEIKKVSSKKWRYPVRFAVQDGIGKKNAVLNGFNIAKGDILLMYDSDGEIPTSEIEKFYNELKKNQNIFVCGNRFIKGRKKKMHPLNWAGNFMFALIVSYITKYKFRDALLGIKGFWHKHYHAMIKSGTFNNDFDRFAELDLIFGAKRIGLKFKTIPAKYESRRYGKTKVNRTKTGWNLLKRCFLELRLQFI